MIRPYLNPATILDLATFVNVVVLYDHVFHVENSRVDTLALNEAIDEPVIVSIPLGLFDRGVVMDAGLLADAWTVACNHCYDLLNSDERSEQFYTERQALESAWEALLGCPISIEVLLDDFHISHRFDSDGPSLIRSIIDTIGDASEQVRFTHYEQTLEAAPDEATALTHIVAECNYRCYFNDALAGFMGLRYMPNSFRMPFHSFLFQRARRVDKELPLLEIIDNEYRSQVMALAAASSENLVLPMFLTAALAKTRRVNDFGPVLARLRRRAAPLRKRRSELDDAIARGEARVIRGVRRAMQDEAGRLGLAEAIGPAAGATGAVLSALSGAPGPMLLAAVAILAFASQYPKGLVERLAKRATSPHEWVVAQQSATAKGVANAYPTIAELWGLPRTKQQDFSRQFARLAAL